MKTAIVPCGTCTLCCYGEAIILHPEHGDNPEDYDVQVIEHPVFGKPVFALKHRADGACQYLGPFGCSIWTKRPVLCREFDCRDFARKIDAGRYKAFQKAGLMGTKSKVAARGRELLKQEQHHEQGTDH